MTVSSHKGFGSYLQKITRGIELKSFEEQPSWSETRLVRLLRTFTLTTGWRAILSRSRLTISRHGIICQNSSSLVWRQGQPRMQTHTSASCDLCGLRRQRVSVRVRRTESHQTQTLICNLVHAWNWIAVYSKISKFVRRPRRPFWISHGRMQLARISHALFKFRVKDRLIKDDFHSSHLKKWFSDIYSIKA